MFTLQQLWGRLFKIYILLTNKIFFQRNPLQFLRSSGLDPVMIFLISAVSPYPLEFDIMMVHEKKMEQFL